MAAKYNGDVSSQGPSVSNIASNGKSKSEEIIFASFLSDFDPSLVFLVTYCSNKHVTYLKVLKI